VVQGREEAAATAVASLMTSKGCAEASGTPMASLTIPVVVEVALGRRVETDFRLVEAVPEVRDCRITSTGRLQLAAVAAVVRVAVRVRVPEVLVVAATLSVVREPLTQAAAAGPVEAAVPASLF
jgi:hypothetical protein